MNPYLFYPHFAGRMNLEYSRPAEQALEKKFDLDGTLSDVLSQSQQSSNQTLSQNELDDLNISLYDLQAALGESQADDSKEKKLQKIEEEENNSDESDDDRLNILDKTITD